MAAVEHIYRYSQPSSLQQSKEGFRLRLVAEKTASKSPIYFAGILTEPLLSAQCLRAISTLVETRFCTPPAMLERILREADPVVTSGRSLLRFEGFSACCSAYARLDISEDGFRAEEMTSGTTNVDFQAEMRAALSTVRKNTPLAMQVSSDALELNASDKTTIEKKVQLPLRWLKGFAEVQALQAEMKLCFRLTRLEALRFFRQVPPGKTQHEAWIVASGRGVRLAHRATRDGVRIKGVERLRVAEGLLQHVQNVFVYASQRNRCSAWVLDFGSQRFTLVLSAEPWRGFSGEGQLLELLASTDKDSALSGVQAALHWQDVIRSDCLAKELQEDIKSINQGLAVLAARGLVGFDTSAGAYFHRVLPFDMSLVESLHPRLKAARKLVAETDISCHRDDAGVRADVPSSDVIHRVHLSKLSGDQCTCPWFAKHQGERGPCKHVLAVRLKMEEVQ